jgi:hypothetical protein
MEGTRCAQEVASDSKFQRQWTTWISDAGFVPNSQLKSQGQIQKARILSVIDMIFLMYYRLITQLDARKVSKEYLIMFFQTGIQNTGSSVGIF